MDNITNYTNFSNLTNYTHHTYCNNNIFSTKKGIIIFSFSLIFFLTFPVVVIISCFCKKEIILEDVDTELDSILLNIEEEEEEKIGKLEFID